MRLRVSGTDANTGYYRNGILVDAASASGFQNGNTDNFGNALTTHSAASNAYAQAIIEIHDPAVAKPTTIQSINLSWNGTAQRFISAGGFHTTATAYDGFTIFLSSGNYSGTFKIYGYN